MLISLSYICLHEKPVSLDSSLLYRIKAYCTQSFLYIDILDLYIDSTIVYLLMLLFYQ